MSDFASLLNGLQDISEEAAAWFFRLEEQHTFEFYTTLVVLAMMAPLALAAAVVYMQSKPTAQCDQNSAANPPNTVVLCGFPPISPEFGLPNLSPYITKLQMYLRISGTPYVFKPTLKSSSKAKMPYLIYNGVEVADSHFAIKWLEKEGLVKNRPDADLDTTEAGAVEAYRNLLIGLYDVLLVFRWLHPANASFPVRSIFTAAPKPLKPIIAFIAKHKFQSTYYHHGLGRHTEEELIKLADGYLAALASLLGQDEYLMGTETPTTLDCCAYGVLSQIVLASLRRGGVKANGLETEDGVMLGLPNCEFARGVTPNLVRYVKRVGERWFPECAGVVPASEWERLESEAAERLECRLNGDNAKLEQTRAK